MKINKEEAISDLLSAVITILPMGIMSVIQLIIPVMVRTNEKIQVERDAIALMESAQETTFLSRLIPNVLLALCAAFVLNFILILFYSREKKNPDIEMMSGTCSHFEVKKPEIM